jgi:DNA topoisomerase-3
MCPYSQSRRNHSIVGPCQFPTLGFVVARYSQVNSFVPEPFWYIYLSLTRRNDETVFTWRRGHLFEYSVAAVIYEHVLEEPTTRVTKVVNKTTKKWSAYSVGLG